MENLSTWETEPGQAYRYNGKERDTLSGWTDFGARWGILEIGRFSGIDRFAEKFPGQSPYTHAGNNPISFIDMNGDSIDVYSSAGNYLGTRDDGKTEITGLYYQTDKTLPNGSCEYFDGVSFSYNDISDRKDAMDNLFDFIVATDTYINSFVDRGVKGMSGSLRNTMKEGQHQGSIDFNSGPNQVPGNTLTITKSAEGGTVAYNVADFGNYLTGQTLNRLGYAPAWTAIFGHGNNIINGPRDHGSRERSGWLDSKADQRALRNGYGHFKPIEKFVPNFPRAIEKL